jgi:hypothetical protein
MQKTSISQLSGSKDKSIFKITQLFIFYCTKYMFFSTKSKKLF